jgi:hypothetical protein
LSAASSSAVRSSRRPSYKNPYGLELRVFLEPEEKSDLLMSEVARFDFTPLEEKATSLREVLLEKGWTQLGYRPSRDSGRWHGRTR